MYALAQAVAGLPDSWDPSQRAALEQALSQRVSLIQGPPGTGKTFTGVELCSIILDNSTANMLVVCYTNHALDQFLEALLDKGVDSIVRIGGRSKSKRLEPYNLRQLTGAGGAGKGSARGGAPVMTGADSRQMRVVRDEIVMVEKQLDDLAEKLTILNTGRTSSTRMGGGGKQNDGDGLQELGGARGSNSSKSGRGGRGGGRGRGRRWEQEGRASIGRPWQQQNTRETFQRQGVKTPPPQQQQGLKGSSVSGGGSGRTWQEVKAGEVFSTWEWSHLQQLLKEDYPDVWEQLRVPEDCSLTPSYLWEKWVQGKRERPRVELMQCKRQKVEGWQLGTEEGGVEQLLSALPPPPPPAAAAAAATAGTGAASSDAAAAAAAAGGVAVGAAPAPATSAAAVKQDIWALPYQQRQQKLHQWRQAVRSQWLEELQEQLQAMHKLQEQLRSLRNSSAEAVIGASRIVGCTTTGAALYKELLVGPGAPSVVLVEEAAEILEAHVLTSLSPNTQHLIMIGDHKQLRPKVESYELSVQAGRGHTLNVSLFERLVLAGFPHATLAVQHRMHPDVSALIRHTYPSLIDAPKVKDQPPVLGVASRVVFIDHREPELQEKERGLWRKGSAEHQSKVNEHEVGMVAAVVRYLRQQGYASGQLVVLTPYLGQLLELQKEISREMQVGVAGGRAGGRRCGGLAGGRAGGRR